MRRMIFASAAAVAAFKVAWARYDADEIAANRFLERQAKRQEALHTSFAALSDSDQHFLNTFVNNLNADERPSRADIERFASILETLPEDARIHVLRQAVAICPALVCIGPVAKLVRGLDIRFERVQ